MKSAGSSPVARFSATTRHPITWLTRFRAVKGCAFDRKNRTFEGLGKNSSPLQSRSRKWRITNGVRGAIPLPVSRFVPFLLPSIEFIEEENRPVSKFSVTNRLLCRKKGKKDLSSTFFFFFFKLKYVRKS